MKRWIARVCLSSILAGAAAQTAAWPQTGVRAGNLKVDSNLVLVNVAVTDARGRFVTGLAQQDFQVFEEKTAQRVAYFSTEEAPVSVGLVLDFSGSMMSRFGELKAAVAEFLKSANPADEFCLIESRKRRVTSG